VRGEEGKGHSLSLQREKGGGGSVCIEPSHRRSKRGMKILLHRTREGLGERHRQKAGETSRGNFMRRKKELEEPNC